MDTKRRVLAAAMFLAAACVLHTQAMPRLAILPFTGGGGADGETIAQLLGIQPELRNAFTPVSRTAAVEAIMREHRFQRSGLTDSYTIADLGRQMNADYVVAGHIQQLGRSRLVHITVVHVESFRQVAGDFMEYSDISEIRAALPDMARRIASTARRSGAGLPTLAVFPFNVASGAVNEAEAEILAQLLATEVANGGRHAVFPRTVSLESVMAEHRIQRSGLTDHASIRELGRAVNVDLVLSGTVVSLGATNLFIAEVLNVQTGEIIAGGDAEYRDASDGLVQMQVLAQTINRARASRIGEFVRVPGGTFLMGSPAGAWASRDDERPVRSVTVNGFYMSRFPVTQGEWVDLMGSNPSWLQGARVPAGVNWRNLPVDTVSWFDAVEFANRMSLRAGLTPAYTISRTWDGERNVQTVTWNRNANGYRLPTEAEWEFAARGGHGSLGNFTFSGGNAVGEVAWYSGNSGGRTHEVGTRRSNALGIYDMSGNISEWVYDRWGAYPNMAQTNPVGAVAGDVRMLRGGCFSSTPAGVRSAHRFSFPPGSWVYGIFGFRLVRP